ncbi:unnamed protein product [Paramecium primaurelia]|uniref:Uncharacterized protein n=1 Tax=Paramecium primaurelia TaxID=5886 RepID=A0A8S1NE67_PARPR|nr:unnamed protein product [Paramecium primaurelia]
MQEIAPSELTLKPQNPSLSNIEMGCNFQFSNLLIDDKALLEQSQLIQQLEAKPCPYNGIIWNYNFNPPRKTRISYFISQINQMEVQYIYNGLILRKDQVQGAKVKSEVLHNLEQIKYLFWLGDFGNDNFKVGSWKAIWKGEQLKHVGGWYSNEGKKYGLWKELIKDYWTKAQVYEVGGYENDFRQGLWKLIYRDKQIGGGVYDQNSQKNGKWVELCDGFWDYSQIISNGVYKNGKKIGDWNIFQRSSWDKPFQIIGGGCYDGVGSSKIGKWIELNDGCYNNSLITCNGVYQNNKKVGKWNIFYRCMQNKPLELIGGGCYDGVSSSKIGRWIELNEDFGGQSEVTFIGEYKNGKKVGKWDVLFRNYGGGSFNERGSVKNGKWIDLSEGFWKLSQVTFNGEYKNGEKVGKWDIFYRSQQDKGFKLIGGGSYNQVGSTKNGRWIELSNEFWFYSQFIQNGEYNNGQKIGKWLEIDIKTNEQRKEINF